MTSCPKRRLLPAMLLAALPWAVGPLAAQQFEIGSGADVVAGQPIDIRLSGLPADAEVEVGAERVLKNHWQAGAPVRPYRATARFRADGQGHVDLGRSASLGGSFTGVDPSGLFWSMEPVAGVPAAVPTDAVRLVASIAGNQVAAASLRMRDQADGFAPRAIPGFPGSYFAAHEGTGRRPVIIVVDGADANSYGREVLLPRLAAEGFATVHFATYALVYGGGRPAVEGLPTRYVDIPVDRLQALRDWLARQPGVDADRIGLYGVSRNGAYVLLAATRFPWARAVAGIVPSDVVWEGWGDGVPPGTTSSYSWRGRPLAYVPYDREGWRRETARIARGQPFRLRTAMDEGRWAHPERVSAARIPLETYRGALFLAGGEQDLLWSSGHMIQNIAERRAAAGLATTTLIFPDAGHNLGGDGWTPTMLFEAGAARAAEARAQYRTWRALVDFFKGALRPERVR